MQFLSLGIALDDSSSVVDWALCAQGPGEVVGNLQVQGRQTSSFSIMAQGQGIAVTHSGLKAEQEGVLAEALSWQEELERGSLWPESRM